MYAFGPYLTRIVSLFAVIPAARSRHRSGSPLTYHGLPQTASRQSTQECTFTKFTSHIPSAARHSSDLWNLEMLYRMKATGVMNEGTCAEMCCDFGPDCQYAWLYESDCYAVNCSSNLASFCEPYSSSKIRTSTYIQVHRTGNHPPLDSSDNYQGASVENGGETHQVKPSVTVSSPRESSSVTFSAPVLTTTVVSEPMPLTTVLPAVKTPSSTTLLATSKPPVEPHKPPEDEEEKPVQDCKPSLKCTRECKCTENAYVKCNDNSIPGVLWDMDGCFHEA